MQKGNSIIELIFVLFILGLSFNFSRIKFEPNFCNRAKNFLESAQTLAISSQQEVNVEVLKSGIKILDSSKKIQIPKYENLTSVNFGNLIYSSNIISYRNNGTASAGRINFKKCSLIQSIYGAKRIE